MSNIKMITLNVKGINHIIKGCKILSSLKKDRVQIALLQETHLTDSEHLKLKRDWVGQIYYSSFNSKSRGIVILIHKNLPFTLNTIVRDTDGRFILITGLLYGEQILLEVFMHQILLIDCFIQTFWQKPPLCVRITVCNPHVKDFIFFSHPHFSFSRIDYMFVSRSVLDRTRGCLINTCAFSDHSSVSMGLLPPYYDPLSRHWRLNPAPLSDPEFVKYLENQWELFLSTNELPGVSASTLWEVGKAFLRGSIIAFTSAKKKSTLTKQLVLERDITNLEREVSADTTELYRYKLNFKPIVASIKNDLNRWFDRPLSWMGRISLIKMNVLPRILYPIQMLALSVRLRRDSESDRH
uniref:Endonuclease/exonuclease/phosphatase domain-containing protein n=1 Tax=Pundamilia nyererei TaxID=303518 RepID=A0A3B4H1Y3_9CICH